MMATLRYDEWNEHDRREVDLVFDLCRRTNAAMRAGVPMHEASAAMYEDVYAGADMPCAELT